MIKLSEEEIYRINLLVKQCLKDISTSFLKAPESHFAEPNINPHYKILSFHNMDNMKVLVRKWYQEHACRIGYHTRYRFSQFSLPVHSIPYNLEMIQFYIKKIAPFYFNSLVIKCIEEEGSLETIESFLSDLFPCILERIYWLAWANNKNNLAAAIAENLPIVQEFESFTTFLDSALYVGDFKDFYKNKYNPSRTTLKKKKLRLHKKSSIKFVVMDTSSFLKKFEKRCKKSTFCHILVLKKHSRKLVAA